MLKLREMEEPTLRTVTICTVCCQEMKATEEIAIVYDVAYHARCAHVVHAAEKEAARERRSTEN